MKPFRSLVVATALVTLAGGIAYTADQTILGRVLTLKNKQDNPNQRRAIGRAKEKDSVNTIVGNPTVGGATLTVPPTGRRRARRRSRCPRRVGRVGCVTGYKYKDPSGTFGAVKRRHHQARVERRLPDQGGRERQRRTGHGAAAEPRHRRLLRAEHRRRRHVPRALRCGLEIRTTRARTSSRRSGPRPRACARAARRRRARRWSPRPPARPRRRSTARRAARSFRTPPTCSTDRSRPSLRIAFSLGRGTSSIVRTFAGPMTRTSSALRQ